MPEPTTFEIIPRAGLWAVMRDGREIHTYGHADRAVHEAVRLARELEHTGEPSKVCVQAADGKMIEVTTDEPAPRAPEDEHSSVVPDRSGSA